MPCRFSIIIIHRNGLDRLRSTLDSVVNASDSHDEILIVDNASTDNSISQISKIYPKIQIIRNKFNLGYGHAANQGINSGKGKYYLICNNDIVLPLNIFKDLEELFIKEPKAGIISGQQTNLDGIEIRTTAMLPTYLIEFDGIGKDRSKDPINISEVGILRGACLASRRQMVEEIGGFDEDFFFYFEDTEWCMRLRNKGWKILFSTSIQVFHEGGGSTSKYFLKSRIEFMRSRIYLCQITFSKPQLICLMLWNVPKLFLDWIYYFLCSSLSLYTKRKYTDKFLERSLVICWLCIGMPKSWGLPKNYSEG